MHNKKITMEIPGAWGFSREIRRIVEEELREFSDALRYTASMVASELVGNAIKYSDWNPSAPQATFSLAVTPQEVSIAVANCVKTEQHFAEVKKRIDQLTQAENKEEFYLARLQELLSGSTTGSQLGIYRIGYEGEFDLSYTYADDVLTIIATRGLS
jgi:hypothetical protein